jgi:hypothetical protein
LTQGQIGRQQRHDKRGQAGGRRSTTGIIIIRHGQTGFNRITREAWSDSPLVTHWGFIKVVTGLSVPNEAALQIDSTDPDRTAEPLYLSDTG